MQDAFTSEFSNTGLLIFYGWWQMAVCFFAFIALMSIWWHIGRRQGDLGQVWLALSILSWSFSGMTEVAFAGTMGNEVYLEGFRSICSLLNSLFILLGLPWFRYLPSSLKPIIQSNYWKFIVGLPFLFSLLPTISRMVTANAAGFINELDVYYSVLTLIFLGYVLWESFAKRRLKLLAWLSVLCIITTFVAQAYKLTDSQVNLILFSAIFKTSLIMIFFALALSWVKDLAENIIPASSRLGLHFFRSKSGDKVVSQVLISGIPIKTDAVKLSSSLFDLLLTFALRRETENEWLEIKPKRDPRVDKQYDINDHNEIKRLIGSLLDGLFGKGNWTNDQHELPLRNALFEMSEKRERKIRLAIPKANLNIDEEMKAVSAE